MSSNSLLERNTLWNTRRGTTSPSGGYRNSGEGSTMVIIITLHVELSATWFSIFFIRHLNPRRMRGSRLARSFSERINTEASAYYPSVVCIPHFLESSTGYNLLAADNVCVEPCLVKTKYRYIFSTSIFKLFDSVCFSGRQHQGSISFWETWRIQWEGSTLCTMKKITYFPRGTTCNTSDFG